MKDDPFIRFALEKRLVSREQLQECVVAAQALAEEGDPTPVKELLMQYGYLSPGRAAWIEQSLRTGKRSKAEAGPTRFGAYELIAPLGRGGMASVYLARREGQRGLVALKVLHPEVSERSDGVDRLMRETRALFKLEHRHIVRGLEFGNLDGRYYLAMQYVEGQTLKNYVQRNGPAALDKALEWTEQIAGALEYAHRSGFIHRDIKPKNLILARDGSVKILDFGLSKSVFQDEQDLTQEGRMLGTVLYASPEQLRGSSQIDARTDLYSLGITLYFLLSGEVPFRGPTTTATAALHFEKPLPRLQKKRPEMPDPVCHLLERLTRKSPLARYQTAGQVLDDVRLLRSEGRISETEPGDPSAEPGARAFWRSLPLPGVRLAILFFLAASLMAYLAFQYAASPAPGPGRPHVESPSTPGPQAAAPGIEEAGAPIGDPARTAAGDWTRLQEAVETYVQKGDIRSATLLLDTLPPNLRQQPWLSQATDLRQRALAAAVSEFDRLQEEWKEADSSLSPEERMDIIADLEKRWPPDLQTLAESLRSQVPSGPESGTPDPEPEISVPEAPTQQPSSVIPVSSEPDPGDGGVTLPHPEAAASPGDASASNLEKTASAASPASGTAAGQPDAVASSLPGDADQEAHRLFAWAQEKMADRQWRDAAELLRLLQDRYGETAFFASSRQEILATRAIAEAEAAPVEDFFAGRVLAYAQDELDIVYDFHDPKQLDDWDALGGRWETGPKGLRRTSFGRREVLWWRHPHGPEFHFTFQAQGQSQLSTIVAGDGLTADEGSGFLCSLGHYAGAQALIRTDPQNVLERKSWQIVPGTLYSAELFPSKNNLVFRVPPDLDLRARLKSDWSQPRLGGVLRLGLYGAGDAEMTYQQVRIRTEMPRSWIGLERARVRSQLRARYGVARPDSALRFSGKNSLAFIPCSSPIDLARPFTIECWVYLPEAGRERRGTLLAIGREAEGLTLSFRPGPRDLQFLLQLGPAKEPYSCPLPASDSLSGGWHHLAVCSDGEEMTLSFDGKRLRRDMRFRKPESTASFIVLGYASAGGLSGCLDDLRFSRGVRFPGVFVPERPLKADADAVLLFSFDEGEGHTAYDSASGGQTPARLYGVGFELVADRMSP
ncbi:MAG: protein kinase [Planctomycetes bacterium]|nr:protein kinase [Planctomycetota bacterium]